MTTLELSSEEPSSKIGSDLKGHSEGVSRGENEGASEEGNECRICLLCSDGDVLTTYTSVIPNKRCMCKMLYHNSCLLEWFGHVKGRVCPTCKQLPDEDREMFERESRNRGHGGNNDGQPDTLHNVLIDAHHAFNEHSFLRTDFTPDGAIDRCFTRIMSTIDPFFHGVMSVMGSRSSNTLLAMTCLIIFILTSIVVSLTLIVPYVLYKYCQWRWIQYFRNSDFTPQETAQCAVALIGIAVALTLTLGDSCVFTSNCCATHIDTSFINCIAHKLDLFSFLAM